MIRYLNPSREEFNQQKVHIINYVSLFKLILTIHLQFYIILLTMQKEYMILLG